MAMFAVVVTRRLKHSTATRRDGSGDLTLTRGVSIEEKRSEELCITSDSRVTQRTVCRQQLQSAEP